MNEQMQSAGRPGVPITTMQGAGKIFDGGSIPAQTVRDEMENLANSLHALHETMHKLEQELAPVLARREAVENIKVMARPIDESASPLACRIAELDQIARNAIDVQHSILRRLDLGSMGDGRTR